MKFKSLLIKIKSFVLSHKFPIIIIGIWLLICFANFTPNTFLTGWDNLHPEFDYSMNLKRLLTSSWAEYQGLGAPGAHSHAAEIPRMIILGVLQLFLSTNLIRYVFIFAMLLIGALGVYNIVRKVFLRRKDPGLRDFAAFAATLFYMLNVGTVQHFIAPFEMFNVQYALIPWLIFLVIRYLETKKYKYLLYFGIVTFFSAPMAYAVMLWIAYFGGLTIFVIINFLLNRKKNLIIPSILIIVVTILVNLFWLVPNLYFVFNHSDYVPTAKTNLIFSEEAFLTNQKYGNLVDIFLNKGFLFDWQIRNNNNTFEPIMGKWDTQMDNPIVLAIALLCFALIVAGILYSIYRKQKYLISLIGVLIFAVIVIMGTNPPFGGIWEVIVSKISALQEAIRFPFTKFSILFIFSQTVFLSVGVFAVSKLITKKIKFQGSSIFALIFLLLISFIYSLPTFQGNFINKNLRLDIPQDYFQLFDYFKQQPKTERIANFPVNTLFGWFYTDWGYQGSGFLWYGIEQPILDRDFDRWYTTLEDYYDEISSAVYTNDAVALQNVFKKYAIDWVVIDEHVTSSSEESNYVLNPDLASSELAYKETAALLAKIPGAKETAVFGKIHVYNISGLDTDKDYIDTLAPSSTIESAPIEDKSVFLEDNFGRKTKESFFKELNSENINYYNNIYTLSNNEVNLNIPQIYDTEKSIPTSVSGRIVGNILNVKLKYQIPSIDVNNQTVINVTKTRTLDFYLYDNSTSFYLTLDGQSILLSNLDSAWQDYGEIDVSTQHDMRFVLYNKDTGEDLTTKLDLSKASLNNCNAKPLAKSSSTSYDNGVLNLKSTGENICVDFSVNTLGTVYSLYNLQMDYRSNQGVTGDSCIKFSDGCVNSKEIRSDYLPTFWYPFNTYAEDTDSNKVNVSIVFNNATPNNSASINYRNIKFYRYSLVDSLIIPLSDVKNDLQIVNTTVKVKPIDTKIAFKFTIPWNKKYNFDYTKLQQVIPLTPKDCKSYVPNIKLDRSLDSENKAINLDSIDGFNCENINLYNISLKNGFLINLNGENISGPGLVLNISDFYYKKVYYTNRLAVDGAFNESLVLPNMVDSKANGLNIFVNNQSVGKEETINSIKGLSISPIIYNWLSSIKVDSIPNFESDQSVVNVDKSSTTTYKADINPSSSDRVLKFNQSYEANWLAYDQNGNLLKRFGEPNSNTEKSEWNNYWILPAGTTGIYIEYRTQTYQYFAYLIVFLTFGSLVTVTYLQSERAKKFNLMVDKTYKNFKKTHNLFIQRRVEPKLDKYKKFNKKGLQ